MKHVDVRPYLKKRVCLCGAGLESWFSSKTHHYESESKATDLFLASTRITSNSWRRPFVQLAPSAEVQWSKSSTLPVETVSWARVLESGNSDGSLCLFAPPTRLL